MTLTLHIGTGELTGPEGAIPLSRQQATVLRTLARGNFVAHGDLIAALWPDPIDAPDRPSGTIRVLVCHLRRHLAHLGVPHPIEKFIHRGYRLRPGLVVTHVGDTHPDRALVQQATGAVA